MYVVIPTLLYLGLYLAQSTQTQEGNLPPPVIIAQPGSMVLKKTTVTILCQGPPDAEVYKIYKGEECESRDRKNLPLQADNNTLNIQELLPDRTGLYCCSYKSGEQLSRPSNILRLVMTGAYDKPSLWNMTGMVVASGDSVKLKCFSKIKFPVFILIKEDSPQPTERQSSIAQNNVHQAIFHIDYVTTTQSETYQCYGAFNEDPYVWSHPSDPLELVVIEAADDPTLVEPGHPPAATQSPNPNHNPTQGHQGVLIGLPVGILLLLLLLLLFVVLRHRCCCKAKNNATKRERQPQAAEPMNGPAPEARDSQDVTYTQVAFDVPTHGAASAASLSSRQTQTCTYATLTLR